MACSSDAAMVKPDGVAALSSGGHAGCPASPGRLLQQLGDTLDELAAGWLVDAGKLALLLAHYKCECACVGGSGSHSCSAESIWRFLYKSTIATQLRFCSLQTNTCNRQKPASSPAVRAFKRLSSLLLRVQQPVSKRASLPTSELVCARPPQAQRIH